MFILRAYCSLICLCCVLRQRVLLQQWESDQGFLPASSDGREWLDPGGAARELPTSSYPHWRRQHATDRWGMSPLFMILVMGRNKVQIRIRQCANFQCYWQIQKLLNVFNSLIECIFAENHCCHIKWIISYVEIKFSVAKTKVISCNITSTCSISTVLCDNIL